LQWKNGGSEWPGITANYKEYSNNITQSLIPRVLIKATSRSEVHVLTSTLKKKSTG